MITLRTISERKRRVLFVFAALADIVSRIASARFQYDLVLFKSGPELADMMSVSQASGLAVPMIAAPLILSPIAYFLGHILVLEESKYVRLVSGSFILGSFLCYTESPGLSVLLGITAYLILGSGMITATR